MSKVPKVLKVIYRKPSLSKKVSVGQVSWRSFQAGVRAKNRQLVI